MRIAILKSDLGQRGGVEKYSSHLANAFVQKGSSVTVLTTHRDGLSTLSPYHFDCPLISLGKKAGLSFTHIRDFNRWCQEWLKQNPVDIVFGMDRNSFQTHYRAGNGVHAEYLKKRAQAESFIKKISFKLNPLHQQILNFEKQAYCHPSLNTLFTNSFMNEFKS